MCISDSLSLSHSLFLSSRPEGEACKQKREKKQKFLFFFFLSHPALFFFHLRPFADMHREISGLLLLPFSSLYLDDERVWIRSGRVYGTSIPGLVNEAEIRQPPHQMMRPKAKVFFCFYLFFFFFLKKEDETEGELIGCQTERVYRKGQHKTRERIKQKKSWKISRKKAKAKRSRRQFIWYSIHFSFFFNRVRIPFFFSPPVFYLASI
jgi:hypothetical protein